MGKYTDQQLVECYLKHKSAPKAAAELGVSVWTIHQAAKRLGIKFDGRKYNKGPKRTAKHGTRTMYQHGCRCEACCKAEHQQYLKRKEAQGRQRYHSKWCTDDLDTPCGREAQKVHNAKRYAAYIKDGIPYRDRIRWPELAERFGMQCAICGCDLDPNDTWVSDTGRKCFGRKYPTVDHIIPLKHGGTDTLENVQLTCKRCNSVKGTAI